MEGEDIKQHSKFHMVGVLKVPLPSRVPDRINTQLSRKLTPSSAQGAHGHWFKTQLYRAFLSLARDSKRCQKQAALQRDELPSFPVSPALLTGRQDRAHRAMGDHLGSGAGIMELPPLVLSPVRVASVGTGQSHSGTITLFHLGKKLQLLLCPAQWVFSQSCRELKRSRRSLDLAVPLSWLYRTKHFQLATLFFFPPP